MKLVFSICLVLTAFVRATALDFAEPLKEVNLAADAETVAAEFTFTNRSEKPVTIAKADAGCACMKILFSGGKLSYAPGESGVMRTVFRVGNAYGTVDKTISLWLDTPPDSPPSQSLTARFHVPPVVTLEPRTVRWEHGGKSVPQTIRIGVAEGKPIHITGVEPSTEQFSCELKTVEDGRKYDLVVTPKDMDTVGIAVIRIRTDCVIPKHQTQQAFAVVGKPGAEKVKKR